MKIIEVVAAIIFDKDKIFATQRGYGEFKDWWEFPGGKIEKNEAKQDALKREIKEELDVDISIEDFITTVEYDYPNFHLIMYCFKCSLINGYPKLLEHEDSKWVDKKNISDLKWLPADLALIDILKEIL